MSFNELAVYLFYNIIGVNNFVPVVNKIVIFSVITLPSNIKTCINNQMLVIINEWLILAIAYY